MARTLGTIAVAACGDPDKADSSVRRSGLPSASKRRHVTNFDLTEFPISEGGAWFNTGEFWTRVRTADGLAYGSNGSAGTYDDSYAYLTGFPPDQMGAAVVHVDRDLVGAPHEVELLLRWADSARLARGYECLFNFQGGVQIMRWNGPFGDFTELAGVGKGGIGRKLVTGDVIGARIVGDTIAAYINRRRIYTATDSTWTEGQPGIGFFKRSAGRNSDFAMTSYVATAL